MRVLIAGHTGLPFGGIATYCESLLGSSLTNKEEIYFVETSQGGTSVSSRGGWSVQNLFNALQNIARFLLSLYKVRPDLIHIMTAHMPSMLKNGFIVLFGRAFGAKVILHPHCSVDAMFPVYPNWHNSFAKFIFGRCHAIFVLSSEWLQLEKEFEGVLFIHLPNGINISKYLKIERPRPEHVSTFVEILFLGHLGASKGTLDLLLAISELQDFHSHLKVSLVGEPFDAQSEVDIRSLIRKLGLSEIVNIYPPVYDEEKIMLISKSDIYILPSHSEGMPISIIESMAAGLPVIATKVGAIPEMVQDQKTGLLINVRDPHFLAIAISRLLKSSSLRLKMGLDGREHARDKFDIESSVSEILKYYSYVGNLS